MLSRLENMSINNTEDIQHHTTEQMSFFTTQAQHAISNKIQHTEEKLETKLHETTSYIKEVKENQEKFKGKNVICSSFLFSFQTFFSEKKY